MISPLVWVESAYGHPIFVASKHRDKQRKCIQILSLSLRQKHDGKKAFSFVLLWACASDGVQRLPSVQDTRPSAVQSNTHHAVILLFLLTGLVLRANLALAR